MNRYPRRWRCESCSSVTPDRCAAGHTSIRLCGISDCPVPLLPNQSTVCSELHGLLLARQTGRAKTCYQNRSALRSLALSGDWLFHERQRLGLSRGVLARQLRTVSDDVHATRINTLEIGDEVVPPGWCHRLAMLGFRVTERQVHPSTLSARWLQAVLEERQITNRCFIDNWFGLSSRALDEWCEQNALLPACFLPVISNLLGFEAQLSRFADSFWGDR